MAEPLKPCPFCGRTAQLCSRRVAEDAEVAFVRCCNCAAQTEYFEDAYAPREDARLAWNTRALASSPTAADLDKDAEIAALEEIIYLYVDPTEVRPKHELIVKRAALNTQKPRCS